MNDASCWRLYNRWRHQCNSFIVLRFSCFQVLNFWTSQKAPPAWRGSEPFGLKTTTKETEAKTRRHCSFLNQNPFAGFPKWTYNQQLQSRTWDSEAALRSDVESARSSRRESRKVLVLPAGRISTLSLICSRCEDVFLRIIYTRWELKVWSSRATAGLSASQEQWHK